MNNTCIYSIRKHFCSWALALVVCILSLAPFPEIKVAEQVPLYDKWVHMLMYGAISITFGAEHLLKYGRPLWTHLFFGSVLLPISLGGIMELAQAHLTSYRSGDWLDFVADGIGVVLACLILPLLHKNLLRLRQHLSV